MTNKSAATILVLALLFAAPSAHAQTLVDGANIDGIVEAAREYGSATRASQPDGNPMIAGKIEGIPYFVRFRNCSGRDTCSDINIRVGFLVKPPIEAINAWNRDKRFSKAYLDAEGDAILEMDVVLVGGVSQDNMSEIFSYWRLALDQFTRHIGFK